MVYSRTPKTIAKIKSLLDEMVECDIDLEWSVSNPKKAAYYIWQAIKYSIRSGKEEYKEYAKLGSKYRIKIVDGFLKAELKNPPTVHGTIVREVSDVLEVLGAAIGLKLDRMLFPNITELNYTDRKILYTWCTNNNYSCDVSLLGISLNKRKDV